MVYSSLCFFKLQCQKVSLHLEQLNEKHRFFIENYNNFEKNVKKVLIFAYFAKYVSEYLFIMFNMDTLDSHSYSTNFKW